MTKRNIDAIYPLSPMQQGMLFHSIYEPESGVYVEQLTCLLEGDLNVQAFQQAWQKVVERHPILRTSFVYKRLDRTLQVVHKQVNVPFEYQDWRHLSTDQQETRLEQLIEQNHRQGFKLNEAPLLRLELRRLSEQQYQFLWCHHHLLLDGWSLPLVIKEVFACYEAYRLDQQPGLSQARPYQDYITWLQQQDMMAAKSYWQKLLAGFTAPTPLVIDQLTNGKLETVPAYAQKKVYLSEDTTSALQSFARKYQLTLNTIVQGAWAILLSRYSGEADVVFGTTVSGRPTELDGVEAMIGLFINTLPLRVQVAEDIPLIPWLNQLQKQQFEQRQYEYSPLTEIQNWSSVPHDLPLFNSILVFENYPVDSILGQQNTSLKVKNIRSFEQTNYPITAVASPGKELFLQIAYDAGQFHEATILRMLNHWRILLVGFVSDEQQKIETLPMLTETELKQIVVEWNDTAADYPADRCIHELFESQVEQSPDAIALIFESEQISYQELNRRSNQLARYLRKQGVQPEVLVGICMERSIDMIVGIMAILKAGGAYVPIDPNYPQDRIAYMLQDSKITVLLTQQRLFAAIPATESTVLCLDSDWKTIAQERDQNLVNIAKPENIAYVIYTSGSTGRPKGTMIDHASANNFILAFNHLLAVDLNDRVLQFASISFDASVAEIFPALLFGSTLVLARQEELSSAVDLKKLLQDQAVDAITLPPSMLALLSSDDLPALKTVISAGEVCRRTIAEQWSKGRKFINAYGPTETAVGATCYQVDNLPSETATIPIGIPIQNKKLYILDNKLRPVPVGVPGELYIGGVGISRGYLNRSELTAEKFIPDPFNGIGGARLYQSGDRARYLLDGNIEYLGRMDHQVKVRGFRIELGEIEEVLSQHPTVKMAAVSVWEGKSGDDKRLIAYVMADQETDAPLTTAQLSEFLKQRLPEYMIPASFIMLNKMPLTPNGKIDRQKLPAPDPARSELSKAYQRPRTPTEELLAGIMAQVLAVEHVGIYDSFFDLGGHSLLGIRLQSRIRDAFQIELPLRQIFESPTVAELTHIIEQIKISGSDIETPPMQPISRDQDLPLSFAQQRLWFLDQLKPNSALYNIPAALRISGKLNVMVLEQSINEIVRRHETLRTTFKTVKGKPYQVIHNNVKAKINMVDLSQSSQTDQQITVQEISTTEAQRPFDLDNGPLLRVTLIQLQEQEYVILFSLHHIIADGWSMAVLIKEVAAVYHAINNNKPSPLSELSIQYADFANWQRNWLTGRVLETQLEYWKQQLAGSPPILELPIDRPRPAVQSFNGSTLARKFSGELLKKLKDFSQQQNVTLFMTLLAAFKTLLYRYSGQTDIVVGIPHANRNRSEIENLIGFFVNTLVMRTVLSDKPTFKGLVKRVRDVAFGAYAHQDMPFETLVEALQPQRDMSHTPLFQVMFVMQNMPMEALQLPDLTLTPLSTESGAAKFDLSLVLAEEDDGLSVLFEYNTDLFYRSTIQRMADHFEQLLQNAVASPDLPISQLSILSDKDQQLLLKTWNETAKAFPSQWCMHQWFEQISLENPQAIAITYGKQQLTYSDLNKRANQMANYLKKLGVEPENLVGICMDRSLEMVISIMATLKAGAAFIPIDPAYPEQRLSYMIDDSKITILLTQRNIADHLKLLQSRVVCVEDEWQKISKEDNANLNLAVDPANLAYVIYTSGSTGIPKGTMLQHHGWCNLGKAQQDVFGLEMGNRILQFSSLSFDASVWEIAMALTSGATLVLTDQEMLLTGQGLLQVLKQDEITTITLPPSVLAVVPDEELPELSTIITAGEACTTDLVNRWAKGRRFFNAYGPTETTVCASIFHVNSGVENNPPIGRPLTNFQLYVVDADLQPVPIGVSGELLVGGIGLARGYLNRPDLTAEKFIPNPFSNERGARLYRTGDLVRYLADGNIEFLGRIDHQVKVRGFRIELGEIETALKKHPDILDAVTMVREDKPGDKRIVAYLILNIGKKLTIGELRSYLRERLPDYMIPSAFMILSEFPLLPSGKVDRKQLPLPDLSRSDIGREYVAPRNETEVKLAAICAQLLNLEKVGVYDNFFELGGHSLLATQFISHIRDEFQVELQLRTLFEFPSIADLAIKVVESPKISEENQMTIETSTRGEKDLEELLAELNQISDDQAELLVAERLEAENHSKLSTTIAKQFK